MRNLGLGDLGFLAAVSGVERDPFFANVSLLLHGDGANGSTTIVDSSPSPKTVTANNGAAISTTEKQFGTGSIFFNGANHSVTFADPQLGTASFTIETWIKTASSVQYAQIIGNENVSNGGFSFLINNNSASGGQFAVYVNGFLIATSRVGDWSDDQWHHVALTRNGSSFIIWVDGISSNAGNTAASMNGTSTWYIGRNNQFAPRNLVGYVDEFRITKGVARYNADFTPPTAPFPDA